MSDQPKRDESKPDATAPVDNADEEEGLRQLMRQLLNTPPQPQKAAKGTGTGRRGRPPKRREE